MRKKNRNRIPWRYCGCGCKGSEVQFGSLYYWKFDDLRGTLYLNSEHRGDYLTMIGQYESSVRLDEAVLRHARRRLEEARTQLREMENALQSI